MNYESWIMTHCLWDMIFGLKGCYLIIRIQKNVIMRLNLERFSSLFPLLEILRFFIPSFEKLLNLNSKIYFEPFSSCVSRQYLCRCLDPRQLPLQLPRFLGFLENLHYCIHIFWDDIWSCVVWSRYGCSFICNKRRFDKRLGHLSRNTCLTRS